MCVRSTAEILAPGAKTMGCGTNVLWRAIAAVCLAGLLPLTTGGCGNSAKAPKTGASATIDGAHDGRSFAMERPARHADDAAADSVELARVEPRGPEKSRPDLDSRPDEPSRPPESKESPKRREIQSGTLTAGSLDDHAGYEEFQKYLSQVMQSPEGRKLPPLRIGRRIVVEVRDADGKGVSDARVAVHAVGDQGGNANAPLFATTTGSNGNTVFLTGLDAPGLGPEFELSVEHAGGEPVTRVVSVEQTPWTIELPAVQAQLPKRLDLALVVDTTGSMGDELNYLKVEIAGIADAVRRKFPEIDQRYALIVYRDEGDQYVTRIADFTESLDEFQKTLARQNAAGGGDYPEAMHVGLENAAGLSWRDDKTARVMFLVGDAPPHDEFAERTFEAVAKLRRRNVAVFPVAASGTGAKAEFILRTTGFLTSGRYLFLTDHSGVGNPHAKPTAPKFNVERLDRLMIRMIATQLAGREIAASEIIATEESDGKPPRFEQSDHEQNNGSAGVDTPPVDPVVDHHGGAHAAAAASGSASESDSSAATSKTAWSWFAAACLLLGIVALDRWRSSTRSRGGDD